MPDTVCVCRLVGVSVVRGVWVRECVASRVIVDVEVGVTLGVAEEDRVGVNDVVWEVSTVEVTVDEVV